MAERSTPRKTAATRAKRTTRSAGAAAKKAVDNGGSAAEDAIDTVAETAENLSPEVVSRGFSDLAQAFFGLSVSVTSATFAFRKFKKVWEAKQAIKPS